MLPSDESITFRVCTKSCPSICFEISSVLQISNTRSALFFLALFTILRPWTYQIFHGLFGFSLCLLRTRVPNTTKPMIAWTKRENGPSKRQLRSAMSGTSGIPGKGKGAGLPVGVGTRMLVSDDMVVRRGTLCLGSWSLRSSLIAYLVSKVG